MGSTKSFRLLLAFLFLSVNGFSQSFEITTNLLEDLKKGRQYNTFLKNNEIDSLFPDMSPTFRKAVGGKEGLLKMMGQLHQKLGKETRLIEEASFREIGTVTYYRISAFENAPSITTKWIWNDSVILGSNITATPEPAPSQHERYKTKTSLILPFRDTWYVAWGGDKPHLNKHITAQDQRYALDFLYAREGNLTKTENPTKNEDYYSFGQEVMAPGSGVVILVLDTVSDNILGKVNTEITPGNHVVIDHKNGEYSLLAHFKKGSIKVKEGQSVRHGDLIGLSGNSGRSEVPHLHYHLQTGTSYKDGAGLPVQFKSYTENGKKVKNTSPKRGQYVSGAK